jgi:hypothetical protein
MLYPTDVFDQYRASLGRSYRSVLQALFTNVRTSIGRSYSSIPQALLTNVGYYTRLDLPQYYSLLLQYCSLLIQSISPLSNINYSIHYTYCTVH